MDEARLARIKSGLPAIRLRAAVPESVKIPDSLVFAIQGATGFDSKFGAAAADATFVELKSNDFPPDTLNLLREAKAVVEVERPPVFRPAPLTPYNRDAAISHHVPEMIATFQLKGAPNLIAAIFDEGGVNSTHSEFLLSSGVSRVSLKTAAPLSKHATHVAGTGGAAGVSPESIGMAPQVSLLSYDWEKDLENLQLVGSQVSVSNHSYGPATGWSYYRQGGVWLWWGDTAKSEEEDANYGKYTQKCAALDAALAANPNLVSVLAAGNERGAFVSPQQQPVNHFVISGTEWVSSNKVRKKNAWDTGGLDTISGMALAKNCITISAINDVPTGGSTIHTTSFSSWGPADDRRVKPDLCANGDRLFSTGIAGPDAYDELSGTSMASPVASGICCLTAELFAERHQRQPVATEVKGILIHTSTDAGPPGPDAMYGWGSINAYAAGRFIADSAEKEILISGQLPDGGVQSFSLTRTNGPARVTMVWADLAGLPNTGGLDDRTSCLVNDLDIKLVPPEGSALYPYSLGGNGLSPAVASGKNSVDNVEVIDIPEGETGTTWTLEVSAARVAPGEPQKFVILLSGLEKQ